MIMGQGSILTRLFLTCSRVESRPSGKLIISYASSSDMSSTAVSALGKYKCRRLEGKVAVVTASTVGIGLAIAERLGHEGAHVVISSRKQNQVDSAVENLQKQGLSVLGMVCHAAVKEDRKRLLERTVDKFGGIDILVSNAAVNPLFGPIFEATEDSWDKIFDVNAKSAFFLSKEVVPYMEKRGGGSIVFMSSILGYNPFELNSLYCVSKTTLFGLVKAMVPQCTQKNIRVNAIAPGMIRTKFSSVLLPYFGTEKSPSHNAPMKRLGMPEECAGAVAFLVSNDASYVTGETIVIGGGVPSRL